MVVYLRLEFLLVGLLTCVLVDALIGSRVIHSREIH